MEKLESIAERIRQAFDTQTVARDQALGRARALTRACSLSIRAVHRDETDVMQEHLNEARQLADALRTELADYPALFYAGYTQDSLKEFAEASITCALIRREALPTPEELDLPPQTYLNGLAESVGEMRRRCLDMLRQDNFEEAERLLSHMDDIYSILVTMDYPDAITNGLRRQTDVIRAIIERTRGDVTFSLRGEKLERSISRLSKQLPGSEALPEEGGLSLPHEEE
ncbi:MAG TPA: haloacid dehalogenase [Anaerolineales bacterium]|nr:haloacid dehalogenase [Anaerolineales bacterium]